MTRIEHFAVFGTDLTPLKDFYVNVLGLRVVVDNSQAPVRGYFLADDRGVALEVIERPPNTPSFDTRYLCHSAFLVDDYPSFRAKLVSLGLPPEPSTEIDTDTFKTCFFRDPADNRFQIVWRSSPLGT
jgi:glyoxylase I family protein